MKELVLDDGCVLEVSEGIYEVEILETRDTVRAILKNTTKNSSYKAKPISCSHGISEVAMIREREVETD